MKKFKELMPGDTIFYIIKAQRFTVQEDQYTNVLHSGINFHNLTVENIHINEMFKVNRKHDSYYNKWSSDVEVPIDHSEKSVFENNEKIYFLDESDRDKLMASMALQEILRIERSIKDFEAGRRIEIEEVLKNYQPVLGKNYE